MAGLALRLPQGPAGEAGVRARAVGARRCSRGRASPRWCRRCWCASRRCSAPGCCPTPSSRSTACPRTSCTSRAPPRCRWPRCTPARSSARASCRAATPGFSTCFRREAGAAGKDTQGIFRVHQFDKVEMFSFVEPEESGDEHERLLAIEEEILQALEIPYRVVNIAADDLGASAAKKYDLEAWLPGQERYRELTSCSNTTDFQARRLEIRYRPEEGAPPRPRAHAQRHGRGGGPHDHRDRGEPPARRRHRGGAGGAAPVRRAGDDLTLRGPRVELVPVGARAPRAPERAAPPPRGGALVEGALGRLAGGGGRHRQVCGRASRARSSATRSGGRTPRRCTATRASTSSSTPPCTAAASAPRRCACSART